MREVSKEEYMETLKTVSRGNFRIDDNTFMSGLCISGKNFEMTRYGDNIKYFVEDSSDNQPTAQSVIDKMQEDLRANGFAIVAEPIRIEPVDE